MSDSSDYVDKFFEDAYAASKKYGIPPEFILAQGSVEDGYGVSYSARNRKNHFGITASGPANEYWNGSKSQSSVSKLWFRIYKKDRDSFMDFARLITSKYPKAAQATTPEQYAKAIANSSYISEKNGDNRVKYESAVKSRSTLMKPMVAAKIATKSKTESKKKIRVIIIVTLSLLLIVAAIFALKKSKK